MVFETLNSTLSSPQIGAALSNVTMLGSSYYDTYYETQRSTMIAVIIVMVIFGLLFLGGCIGACVKSGPKVIPGRILQQATGVPPQGVMAQPPVAPYVAMTTMPPQYKQ